ncbi:hypothetical protein MHK_004525, partial [Candidatus Magnetomorum sp. HK-1]
MLPRNAINILDKAGSRLINQHQSKPRLFFIIESQIRLLENRINRAENTKKKAFELLNEELSLLTKLYDYLKDIWQLISKNHKVDLKQYDTNIFTKAGYDVNKIMSSLNSIQKKSVTKEQITELISDITGIPVSALSESEKEKIKNINKRLKEIIKGQD